MRTKFTISIFFLCAMAGYLHGQAREMRDASNNRPGNRSAKFSGLDPLLQYRISEVMGQDDPCFYFKRTGDKITADRYTQGLSGEISTEGLNFRVGLFHWSVALDSIMNNSHAACLRLASAVPDASMSKNRLELHKGLITEWYVNGPKGFQQGWTIEKPMGGDEISLTLALRTSGNVEMKIQEDGRGISLSDPWNNILFHYHGLCAYDAGHKELQAWFELKGNSLLIHVDVLNAAYPVTVDPWSQSTKLTASDKATYDYLGCSISISSDGNTVAVGALYSSPGGPNSGGSVYIFVKGGGSWNDMTQTAKLTASDKAAGDALGSAVSISSDGSIVAAGADGATVSGIFEAGAVYVFVKGTGAWSDMTQTAKLTATYNVYTGYFGQSVSISSDGSTIVVGSPFLSPGGTQWAGEAFVFVKGSGSWANMTETAKLTASDKAFGDCLGQDVSINWDGSTVVATAYAAKVGGTPYAGAAYIFVKGGGSWVDMTQSAKLTASDKAANDQLGISVSISSDGSTVAAGAPYVSPGGTSNAGAVYIFVKGSGSWGDMTQTAKLTASDKAAGDFLGYGVSLSSDGSIVVAGAPYSDPVGMVDAGAVYLFVKGGGSWGDMTESAKLTASDKAAGDLFGFRTSISADGCTVASGAYYASPGGTYHAGEGYVFASSFCQPSPPPSTIPTLTQWGLIILGIFLVGASTLYIVRRDTLNSAYNIQWKKRPN